MGFYIPAGLLVLCGLYGMFALPRWDDPRYIRQPERRFWSLFRFLDDEEWTDEGRLVRRRYLRFYGVCLVALIVGIAIGKIVER